MSEMTERVALAIASAASVDAGFPAIRDLDDVETPDHWRAQARAAIAAMREPTETMLKAIAYQTIENARTERSVPIPWDQGYRLMIEAALSSSVPATSGPSGLDMPDMG